MGSLSLGHDLSMIGPPRDAPPRGDLARAQRLGAKAPSLHSGVRCVDSGANGTQPLAVFVAAVHAPGGRFFNCLLQGQKQSN
jgi:hypothetical protein